MKSDIPSWPTKLSREERREAKVRREAFHAALKTQTRGTGWRFAQGSIFRRDGDWFISNSPSLAWKSGVIVSLTCKPMALDELFWEIAGLQENKELPLSFRDQGAWVLRPNSIRLYIEPDEDDPLKLAAGVLEWSAEWRRKELPSFSVGKMLAEMGDLSSLKGQNRTIAVCLSILMRDFERASLLCRAEGGETGGFTASLRDKSVTIFDQAREWLAKRRRAGLREVK